MNYKILFISLLSLMLISNVSAGCCVIQNDECTYWNMDQWQSGQEFCNKLPLWGYALNTTWFNVQNCEISENDLPQACQSGFSIPEFSTITALVALCGAGAGFVYLRKKKN